MEKITLEPGVWTRIFCLNCKFQVTSAKAVRVTRWEPTQSVDGRGELMPSVDGRAVPVTPPIDAPYFKTQSYDPQVIDLKQWGFSELTNIFLMPDERQPVDVVVL